MQKYNAEQGSQYDYSFIFFVYNIIDIQNVWDFTELVYGYNHEDEYHLQFKNTIYFSFG